MAGVGPRLIIVGVGAAVWSARQEFLLVRRAQPPRQNEWSLPGGKIEFGETLHAAVKREVREESEESEPHPVKSSDESLQRMTGYIRFGTSMPSRSSTFTKTRSVSSHKPSRAARNSSSVSDRM